MIPIWNSLLIVCGAYLVGSFPSGYIIAQLHGIDIQRFGSGTTGATNVGRALGISSFFVVFLLDFFKSFLYLSFFYEEKLLLLFSASALLLGNTRSCFLHFTGGKGIATIVSIIMILSPQVAVALFLVWVLVILVVRTVGIASVVSAFLFPCVWSFIHRCDMFFWWSIIAASWCIWLHKNNIHIFLCNMKNNNVGIR